MSIPVIKVHETPVESDLKTIALPCGFKCPRCNAEMIKGKALLGAPRGITYEGEWPMKLKDCLKCAGCGHSETIPYADVHFVVPKA